jgi:hypothetical protein
MTQSDWDEICVYIKDHPNCWIEGSPEEGYTIGFSDGEHFHGCIHPKSFLDMIRDKEK